MCLAEFYDCADAEYPELAVVLDWASRHGQSVEWANENIEA